MVNCFYYLNGLPIKNQEFTEEVLFYGDVNINEDRFFSQEEIDFDESSQRFIDADNNIIFEDDKAEEIDFEEKNQRDIFIRLYNSTKSKKCKTNVWL